MGRVKGLHVFVGNFMYITDFVIVEDIHSVIDSFLTQVLFGKPFVEASKMNYDPSLGIVRFKDETDEVAYQMPYKIDQYRLLSNLEKEHKQAVYDAWFCNLAKGFTFQWISKSLQSPPGSVADRCSIV